jgi:hypothetical protein
MEETFHSNSRRVLSDAFLATLGNATQSFVNNNEHGSTNPKEREFGGDNDPVDTMRFALSIIAGLSSEMNDASRWTKWDPL